MHWTDRYKAGDRVSVRIKNVWHDARVQRISADPDLGKCVSVRLEPDDAHETIMGAPPDGVEHELFFLHVWNEGDVASR